MIGKNLAALRKRYGLTQETLSERLMVSRQTVAKWERDESDPDAAALVRMADMFDVTIDDLVRYRPEENMNLDIPPRGKHFFGAVDIREGGALTLPQRAMEVFELRTGDQVLLFGDEERGIAIVPKNQVVQLISFAEDKKI